MVSVSVGWCVMGVGVTYFSPRKDPRIRNLLGKYAPDNICIATSSVPMIQTRVEALEHRLAGEVQLIQ